MIVVTITTVSTDSMILNEMGFKTISETCKYILSRAVSRLLEQKSVKGQVPKSTNNGINSLNLHIKNEYLIYFGLHT